jgi:hypothetical protein
MLRTTAAHLARYMGAAVTDLDLGTKPPPRCPAFRLTSVEKLRRMAAH